MSRDAGIMLSFTIFCLMFNLSKAGQWFSNGSYEYLFGPVVNNFNDAISQCQSMNSNLVIIKNSEMDSFLKSKIMKVDKTANYFIGLKRFDKTRTGFKWIDGTMVSNGYNNWGIGEPNNDGGLFKDENCVFMWSNKNFKWNDDYCTTHGRYICQKMIVTTTSLTTATTDETPSQFTSTAPINESYNESTSIWNSETTSSVEMEIRKNLMWYWIPAICATLLFLLVIIVLLKFCQKRKQHVTQLSIKTPTMDIETPQEEKPQVSDQSLRVEGMIEHSHNNPIYTIADDVQTNNDHLYTAVDKMKFETKQTFPQSPQPTSVSSDHYESMEAFRSSHCSTLDDYAQMNGSNVYSLAADNMEEVFDSPYTIMRSITLSNNEEVDTNIGTKYKVYDEP